MNIKHVALGALIASGGASALVAGDSGMGRSVNGGSLGKGVALTSDPAPIADEASIFDQIWALPKINDSFGFIGRYHGQLWHSDSNDAGFEDAADYDTRRLRLGIAGDVGAFGYEVQWNINKNLDNGGQFFDSIEDVILSYDAGDVDVTLGKLKPFVSGEYTASSKRIKTLERSLLVNQVIPSKLWGANVGGETGEIGWDAGAYFGGFDEDEDGITGDFIDTDSNILLNAAASFDDYTVSALYKADDDEVNEGAKDYEWILSASYVNYGKKSYDGLGLFGEILYAVGEGDVSDAFGLTIMPSYMVTDELEFVLRYHLAVSSDDNGIRSQKRYDRNVADINADTYNGIYAGFNYYIYGDKLKFMTGLEYGDYSGGSEDYSGWTYATGIRLYF